MSNKQSNADVIRQMSLMELVRFLQVWEEKDIDYARTFCDRCEDVDCERCLYDWLEQDSDHPCSLNFPTLKCLWGDEYV